MVFSFNKNEIPLFCVLYYVRRKMTKEEIRVKQKRKYLVALVICMQFLTSRPLVAADEVKEEVPPRLKKQQELVVKEPPKNNRDLLEVSTNENSSSYQTRPIKDTWDFIERMGEDARQVGQKENLYASVMIAQAILESGNGQSQLSQPPYFNLFGIKGEEVSFTTIEDNGKGQIYPSLASFRQYENYEESLQDYAHLLKTGLINDKNFYKGAWKTEAENYQTATKFLTGRYATDIHYNEELDKIISTYHLINYDEDTEERANENDDYIFPVTKAYITSQFGKRNSDFHRGIDLAVAEGTPIKAAKSGKVIQSDYHPSWGNYVAIKHADGLTTLYAHCSRNLVKVGQRVQQGQTIALVGTTGNSTGPHVHFEVNRSESLVQEQLMDPLEVLKIKE